MKAMRILAAVGVAVSTAGCGLAVAGGDYLAALWAATAAILWSMLASGVVE